MVCGDQRGGKEVVSWDAASEPAPRALLEADVVLEGFRPGVWERLGVDLPPTTILCSLTGYGADGPRTPVTPGMT